MRRKRIGDNGVRESGRSRSIDRSINQSTNQSISQSVSQSISQSVNQSTVPFPCPKRGGREGREGRGVELHHSLILGSSLQSLTFCK